MTAMVYSPHSTSGEPIIPFGISIARPSPTTTTANAAALSIAADVLLMRWGTKVVNQESNNQMDLVKSVEAS